MVAMDGDQDPSDDAAEGTDTNLNADEDAFREAFVRGGPIVEDDVKKTAGVKPKKPAIEEVEAAADEEEDDGDVELEEPEELEDTDEEPIAVAGEKDPELAKRLAQVRRNEQRGRDALKRERDAFDRERAGLIAEWKPRIEAAHEFERLKARAATDPAGVLTALGVSEDDFEDVSKILWGLSKAGAADPKNKAAASALRRERELRDQAMTALSKVNELERKLAARDEEATTSRQVDDYLGRVERAAGEETPLLKKSLELRPAATRAKLQELAYHMAKKNDGEAATPREVARAFEKRRRAALERDLPFAEMLKPKAKDGGAIRVENRSGARAGADSAAAKNGANGTHYLTDEEMIRNLREGNLD